MKDQLNAGTPPRQHEHKDDTHHSRTHLFEESEYERIIMTAK